MDRNVSEFQRLTRAIKGDGQRPRKTRRLRFSTRQIAVGIVAAALFALWVATLLNY